MASRDLAAARQAYDAGDPGASIAAHTPQPERCGNSEPGHCLGPSSVAKCAAYGAVDGMTTWLTLSVISASLASGGDHSKVVVAGCIGAAAAAGARDYFKYLMEKNMYERESAREAWEMRNFADGERREMTEALTAQGVAEADAAVAITHLSKHPGYFVDFMMREELRMLPPDAEPAKNGCATLAAFLGASLTPALIAQLLIRGRVPSARATAAAAAVTLLGSVAATRTVLLPLQKQAYTHILMGMACAGAGGLTALVLKWMK